MDDCENQKPLTVNTNSVQHNVDQSQNLSASAEPFQSKTPLKLTIKKLNAVAFWKWNAGDDSCGICRMAFDNCCGDCKVPGDECPLVWGRCSHPFHLHCIQKWLQSQTGAQLCPMCRQEWQFVNAVLAANHVQSSSS